MHISARAAFVITAATLSCAIVGFAIVRARAVTSAVASASAKSVSTGQRAYATVSTSELGTREVIRELVGRAGFQADMPGGPSQRDALLNEVADFLYHRFAQPSSADYKAWRQAAGYRLRDLAELLDPWSIDVAYQSYFGEPFPETPNVEELFDRFWTVGTELGNGANQPVAMADGQRGLCVASGVLTPGNTSHAFLTGELGTDLWHGTMAATMRCWWVPPVSTKSLLDRYGEVVYADVGIILKYADGSYKPFVLAMIWDPRSEAWFLEHVIIYNYPAADVSALEY